MPLCFLIAASSALAQQSSTRNRSRQFGPDASSAEQSREKMTPGATFLGEFSNMKFTEEHVYGVSVELWRQDSSVFGLLDSADGLQGDTPTGLLEDVRLDASNGRISFKAKLTTGLHSCQQHKNFVPSRDLFKFDGTLAKGALVGTLTRFDALHPEQKPQADKVTLERLDGAPRIEAQSYAQWKQKADEILRFRGPKW